MKNTNKTKTLKIDTSQLVRKLPRGSVSEIALSLNIPFQTAWSKLLRGTDQNVIDKAIEILSNNTAKQEALNRLTNQS